ncbi:hypothetical protein BHE90_017531 [Fusarium euwallaceae]|uniref:Uncharacterized protein n=1 Tax=Fusarium euwallaceae TaxID=1147111 RepID=A0A430KXB6_9HYPO|nr:hypothetical protein BHE90_017531 [Fusarium euwallaceae]
MKVTEDSVGFWREPHLLYRLITSTFLQAFLTPVSTLPVVFWCLANTHCALHRTHHEAHSLYAIPTYFSHDLGAIRTYPSHVPALNQEFPLGFF